MSNEIVLGTRNAREVVSGDAEVPSMVTIQPNVLQLNYSENEGSSCSKDYALLIGELTSYLNPNNTPRKPITINMSNGVCLQGVYLTEVIGNPAVETTKIIVKFFTQSNMVANRWKAST